MRICSDMHRAEADQQKTTKLKQSHNADNDRLVQE